MMRYRHFCIGAAIGLFSLSACSAEREPTAPPSPVIEEPDLRIADVVVSDATGDVAYSHGDHWHGSLRVGRGETRPFRLTFVGRTQGSHDAPSQSARFSIVDRPEYTMHITFEDATLARWQGRTDAGTLTGQYVGGTRIIIGVRFQGRLILAAPPVGLVVRE